MTRKKPETAIHILHTVVILCWTVIATLFIGTLVIGTSFFSKTGNLPHILARFWGNTILWVTGIRVTVKGASSLDPEKPYIYMVNHQSNADIPILLGRLPAQFRWLAKAELFKIPVFSRAMKGCGYISINRSDRKSAFESLDRAAKTIREGTSVLIFPEGTRSMDGEIHSFKKGGFVLAVDAGVPIVPIVINGSRSVMPKKNVLIKPARIEMDILDSIKTSHYTRKNKDDLLDHVRVVMTTHLNSQRGGKKT